LGTLEHFSFCLFEKHPNREKELAATGHLSKPSIELEDAKATNNNFEAGSLDQHHRNNLDGRLVDGIAMALGFDLASLVGDVAVQSFDLWHQ
jgi:hypothetical protein